MSIGSPHAEVGVEGEPPSRSLGLCALQNADGHRRSSLDVGQGSGSLRAWQSSQPIFAPQLRAGRDGRHNGDRTWLHSGDA